MSWQQELARETAATRDQDRLRELSTHRLTAVREAVGANPASPPDVLAALVEDPHHRPQYAVANNPSAAAVRAALHASGPSVRRILAGRRDLDEATYEALWHDPDRAVQDSLVTSTDRPELVARATRSDNHHIRGAAACHDLCTDEDFERLSRDPDHRVRGWVTTCSWRLTPEMVERLRRDPSKEVRWGLAAHRSGGSWPAPGTY